MKFTPQQEASIFSKLRTLEYIREHFQLTEEQLEHPKCGPYIIERLKNAETPARLLRERMSIKDFPHDKPFPDQLENTIDNTTQG